MTKYLFCYVGNLFNLIQCNYVLLCGNKTVIFQPNKLFLYKEIISAQKKLYNIARYPNFPHFSIKLLKAKFCSKSQSFKVQYKL